MTTCTINDGTNTVQLEAQKVEINLEKELQAIKIPQVSNYTSSNPDIRYVDLKRLERTINITGHVNMDSFSPVVADSETGRLVLENMLRMQRTLTLTYGTQTYTVFMQKIALTEVSQDESDSSTTVIFDIIATFKEGTSQIG